MQEMALEVKIDGRGESLSLGEGARFEDVMRAIGRSVGTPGTGITRVRLRGEDITGQSWESYLHLAPSDLTGLEVETGDVTALARQTLGSLSDFISNLIRELDRAAGLFRQGQEMAAGEAFSRALDGIQLVSHTTAMIERNLGIDTAAVQFNGRPAGEQLRRLEPILEDMFAAQRTGDWVLLSDLIEYELVPYFRDRTEIVRLMGAKADA
jgi:hypothetical protein